MIVLMGSGELASTMVEVHKGLLARLGDSPRAVFVDTPSGFQLNTDEISLKAVEYFSRRVNHPITIASFKSRETIGDSEKKATYETLETADYILIGPGSPSYATRQWLNTSIPDMFIKRIEAGGCLVTASAAALTLGPFTLPVYEIYKVGQDIHWIDGINVLNHFGLNLVVIPHWNNADGGNHDTRFCFMGKPRMDHLMALLPEDVTVLGIDEHTACILDFEKQTAEIKGIGGITLKEHHQETFFKNGSIFPLDHLQKGGISKPIPYPTLPSELISMPVLSEKGTFKDREAPAPLTISTNGGDSHLPMDSLAPLVDSLLELRTGYRIAGKFQEADAIRKCLEKANIRIEDRENRSSWYKPD